MPPPRNALIEGVFNFLGKIFHRPLAGATHVDICTNIQETSRILKEGATHVDTGTNIQETSRILKEDATHVDINSPRPMGEGARSAGEGTEINQITHKKHTSAAFTLAEVLITLGIIGVVAALTLPTLIADYQEKVLITAAKKGYSTVTNAMNQWNAKNGTIGDYDAFWLSQDNNFDLLKSLSKELNVAQLCNQSNIEKCGGQYTVRQYKKLNDGLGNTQTGSMGISARALLSNGMLLWLGSEAKNGACYHTFWSYEKDSNGAYIPDPSSPTGYKGEEKPSYNCGYIYFDTNGKKSPNQIGRDVFGITFSNAQGVNSTSDNIGNLNYVLANDKLIETENYQHGKY